MGDTAWAVAEQNLVWLLVLFILTTVECRLLCRLEIAFNKLREFLRTGSVCWLETSSVVEDPSQRTRAIRYRT